MADANASLPSPEHAQSTTFPPIRLLSSHFLLHLRTLPSHYAPLDSNRLTMAHFAVAGLDLTSRDSLSEVERRGIIHWVYGLQSTGPEDGGFRGSPCSAVSPLFPPIHPHTTAPTTSPLLPPPTPPTCRYDRAHLASTYSALITLLACGDDLSHIDRPSLLAHLPSLQTPSGCFQCSDIAGDADLRFVYCALAICVLLDDPTFTAIPRLTAAIDFTLSCQTYEGGFALQPHAEAHGAGTYLAVAVLVMTGSLGRLGGGRRERLIRWVVHRQGEGYTGRTNKAADSCYSFWLGGVLRMLGLEGVVEVRGNCQHLTQCADAKRGGFGKEEGQRGDLLHSYMATAGLGLMQIVMRDRGMGEGTEAGDPMVWPYAVQPISAALGIALDRMPPAVADLGFR